MTVRELIEELSRLPQHLRVVDKRVCASNEATAELLRAIVYRLTGSQDACAKAIIDDCERALHDEYAPPPTKSDDLIPFTVGVQFLPGFRDAP